MAALATADELRLFLGGLSAAQLSDARADLLLEHVSDEVLGYTNRQVYGFELKPADVGHALTLNGSGSKVILLPDPPVTAVASIVEDPAGAAAELVFGSDYEWDEDGILTRLNGRWTKRARWYVAIYARGTDGIPDVVRGVVLRVAARAVPNPEGLTQESEGGYASGYAFDASRLPTLHDSDRRALYEFRL